MATGNVDISGRNTVQLKKTVLSVTLAVGLVSGGAAVASAIGTANADKVACVKTSSHHVYLRTACKAGEVQIAAKGDKGDKGDKGNPGENGAKGEKGEPGTNSVVVKHQQILLNSDDPSNGSTIINESCTGQLAAAGYTECYKVTVTGNPAYQPTNAQLYGDNSGSNTWAPDATVNVVYPTTPATGSTQRVFHIGTNGFNQTKQFPLDIWALTVVG